MLDFAEGLSLATSESTCVFDVPESLIIIFKRAIYYYYYRRRP
jgi:hypothetical protein